MAKQRWGASVRSLLLCRADRGRKAAKIGVASFFSNGIVNGVDVLRRRVACFLTVLTLNKASDTKRAVTIVGSRHRATRHGIATRERTIVVELTHLMILVGSPRPRRGDRLTATRRKTCSSGLVVVVSISRDPLRTLPLPHLLPLGNRLTLFVMGEAGLLSSLNLDEVSSLSSSSLPAYVLVNRPAEAMNDSLWLIRCCVCMGSNSPFSSARPGAKRGIACASRE